MMRICGVLAQSTPQKQTWEACTNALREVVGAEVSPESLLRELEHEGLVILSAGEDDSWLVRLDYQRYGDILRAINIVESIMQPQGANLAELAVKINEVNTDEEGLLEALAVVLPEKRGVEITSSELELNPELAHRIFINSLIWRSRGSITYRVDEHIYRALYTPGLWPQVYEVFFRLSLVPDHRLNAENWLNNFAAFTAC